MHSLTLMRRMSGVLLWLALAFIPGYAGTVTIHPGDNIAKAVAANPANTTFTIVAGTYRLTESIMPKNGDSFIGQTACAPPSSSCPAILSGSRIIGPSATFDGTNYKVIGQTQQGRQQFMKTCEPGWEGCFYPEDLFFDGVPLQHLNSASLPTISTGQWWFDYTNHVIYFHDDPSGHTVETSVVPTVAGSPSWAGANNIRFQYLTIEEFAAPLQQGAIDPTSVGGGTTKSSNWVVQNCELLLNHGLGIHLNIGVTSLNNYIHNNGQMGIGGGSNSGTIQSGIVLSGNTITYNNYANVNPGFGAGGIKFGYTLGAVVRGNTINNNAGGAIHFDAYSRDSLIDGNIITDNVSAGIAYEIGRGSNTVVRNNIVQRSGQNNRFGNGPGAAIRSQASSGVNMYCNVIEVDNQAGENVLIMGASNRGNDPNPPYDYLSSTGNSFHHNTVIWDAGAAGAVWYNHRDAPNQPNFFANNPPPDYNNYHLANLSSANFIYDNDNSQRNSRKPFAQHRKSGADVHSTADTNNRSGFPIVTIASPADQSSISDSTTIEASASDASGISKVEFYVDWTLQATATSSPYNFDWTNAAQGPHTVAAMAYSKAGIRACYAVTLNKQ